ncbi:hypothetical protein [Paenibacillus physcomitrellae]|uniref:ABC transporter permease n=1 Tax=Paenibacillus physcomitrellae TaxID=1619311 RepID=A0ABQ1FWU2_9BACL|nr:hypothetical protein [Paenibacillus physcomitrellae]GGA31907.1 hypothetical protein GCM10010917_16310 [Paenibacillus physcomitrellae]
MSEFWRDSLFLFRREWRKDRRLLLWSLFFMVYTGGCISLLVYSRQESDAVKSMNVLLDFLLLMMAPMTGFCFSRGHLHYFRDDSYTQKLYYLKTLPIRPNVIISARVVQLLVYILINSVLMYGTLYIATGGLDSSLRFADYIAFVLTWTGYSFAASAYYLYFEFLRSGKVYMWMSFVLMGLCALAAVVILLLDGGLVNYTIDMSGRYGLLSPLMWASLLIGAAILYLSGRHIAQKIETRDLV